MRQPPLRVATLITTFPPVGSFEVELQGRLAWMWRDLAGLTFLEGATGRSRLQEEVRSSRRLAEQFIRSMWTREGVGVSVGSTETGCTVQLRLGAVGYCYCYCISRRTVCCACRCVSRDLNQSIMCLQSPPVEHGSSMVLSFSRSLVRPSGQSQSLRICGRWAVKARYGKPLRYSYRPANSD